MPKLRIPLDEKEILKLRLRGLTAKKIGRKVGASKPTIVRRLQEIKQTLPAKTKYRVETPITKKHGKVLRLRLKGYSYPRIARRLGTSLEAVENRLREIKPILDERTITLLKLGQNSKSYSEARKKQAVEEFYRQLGKKPLAFGVLKRVARKIGVPHSTMWYLLTRAGINVPAELQRKNAEFAFELEKLAHLPSNTAAKKLKVSWKTVLSYRRAIKRGKYSEALDKLRQREVEAKLGGAVQLPELSKLDRNQAMAALKPLLQRIGSRFRGSAIGHEEAQSIAYLAALEALQKGEKSAAKITLACIKRTRSEAAKQSGYDKITTNMDPERGSNKT